ncbi:TraR/DksA family transcriptional regulator [Anaplasma phagocytophilum]|uniref:DnaK suppressor protein n=8 Tax=Anaplasma phagocytophilum TaxID=948 RepID=A0A098EEP3_ANAPH|nr:TraR/DksA C4-type zinc finger protein [Anaplasma phagocytophilum]KJV60997.1 prokaryotic dksA/traR C4-type zinc finger family protein [Anaplasma phagocytophilum str. Webster]KJV65071.1 prokaryotic dksA/traR C4-type zinc finger family protein [Anaplasma phagocytophilum str. ApMUC09]KJV67633.1 prokaryotic dksA/traR C4-type zinc finger family protein [Anaplasma phagocytophilum str. ApNP]KJZ99311.1 prokaryotic dksA/traR C4-type zinc finger family protein [Anaplasma phagocytophilum str. CR1007]EO
MLPKDYVFDDEDDENYMNHRQLDYFRQKLIQWKAALKKESEEKTREVLQSHVDADLTDMATREYDTDLTLQACNRNDELALEIDKALQRIDEGLYGYCEETGEKIGLGRLKANPVTLYCIEEQERRERQQKLYNSSDPYDEDL